MSGHLAEYVGATDELLEALSRVEQLDNALAAENVELTPAAEIAIGGLKSAIADRLTKYIVSTEEPTINGSEVVKSGIAAASQAEALLLQRRPRFGVSERPVESRSTRPTNEHQPDNRSVYEILSEKIIPVVSGDIPIGSVPDVSILDDKRIHIKGERGKKSFEEELSPAEVAALNLLLASRDKGLTLTEMLDKVGYDENTPAQKKDEFRAGVRAIKNLLKTYIVKGGGTTINRTYQLAEDAVIADVRFLQPADGSKKNG